MKQDLNYTKFIDRYLQNEMSTEERIWFEKEVEGNSNLSKELNIHKKVNAALSDKELIDLKIQLNKIHREVFESTENQKGIIRRIYNNIYIAATVLVLIAVSFTMYLTNRDFSNDKLIGMYYEPVNSSTNFRAADPTTDKLTRAMSFYESKDYVNAISLFESILHQDGSKTGLKLYTGISYLEIKQYSQANERFMNIISNEPNPFVESAKWYLGMSYLMTNNRNKAKEVFMEISHNDGYYSSNAKKILRRI